MTRPLGTACRAVSQTWDAVVENFLVGGGVSRSLRPWSSSYRDRGKGAVQWDALPELFLGPLTKPRGVFVALNPGRADPRFHGRNGIFAKEILEDYGSYTKWAASWPYLRNPWIASKGRNRHHSTRLRFLRDWTGDRELPSSAMACFELYPWHSPGFRGRLAVEEAQEFIEKHIWEPVAELGVPVFAFGATWFSILKRAPGLQIVEQLGAGGRPYGSRAGSRSVIVLRGNGGLTVIAENHRGNAGLPDREETILLRDELIDFCR